MTEEEERFEYEIGNRLMGIPNPNAGMLVTTKRGLVGRTFSSDEPVNGKIRVYTDNIKLLCDPATLTINGYID